MKKPSSPSSAPPSRQRRFLVIRHMSYDPCQTSWQQEERERGDTVGRGGASRAVHVGTKRRRSSNAVIVACCHFDRPSTSSESVCQSVTALGSVERKHNKSSTVCVQRPGVTMIERKGNELVQFLECVHTYVHRMHMSKNFTLATRQFCSTWASKSDKLSMS